MHHEKRYLYELDLLRFLAATMVAIFHLTTHYADLAGAIPFGWVGVQIFFVLSGFVIANSSENVGAGRFLRSRVLRLYPVAMIAAVAGAALLWTGTGGPGVSRLAIVNSFFLGPLWPWIARSYWTLPIEMFFYLVVFALIALNVRNRLERLAMVLCFLSIPYNAFLLGGVLGWWDDAGLSAIYGPINIPLIRHGQFFALGIFIWAASCNGGKMKHRALFALATVVSAVEIWITASVETAPDAPNDLMPTGTMYIGALVVWALAMVFLYRSAVGSIKLPTFEGWRHPLNVRSLLRTMGLATYPLYLMHESFAARIIPPLSDQGVPDSLAVAIAYVAAVLACVVIVRFMEPAVRAGLSALIDGLVALSRFLSPAPRAKGD